MDYNNDISDMDSAYKSLLDIMQIYDHESYIESDYEYQLAVYINSGDKSMIVSHFLHDINIRIKGLKIFSTSYESDDFDCFKVSDTMRIIQSDTEYNVDKVIIIEDIRNDILISVIRRNKHTRLIDINSIFLK